MENFGISAMRRSIGIGSSRDEQEETLRLNSSAVRRIDRDFLRLSGITSQAAVYAFNANTGAWDKTDVVGCLFLYERSTNPKYGFVIMNRKGSNNFVLTFGQDAQIQLQSPYLLLRCSAADGSPVIHCLWFYDETDCHQFGETLQKMRLHHEQFSSRENDICEFSNSVVLQSTQSKLSALLFSSSQKDTKPKVLTVEEVESQLLCEVDNQ